MRERLMELLCRYFEIGDSDTYYLTRVKEAFAIGTMTIDDFEEYTEDNVADIADYLLDNGVIVPPVKTGQTVYRIDDTRVYELTVNGVCDIIYATDAITFSQDSIGRRIFLTREAAEAALKVRENE